jgi:putative acetyltransferase
MKIRLFQPQDAIQIARLFQETVRSINLRDYSPAQVQAWAPDDLNFRNWAEVPPDRQIYVAEEKGHILGFAEWETNGHIDCFYCHKDYRRRGVGRQLYGAIETRAIEQSITRLFTESSITAKPFFQRMGFTVITAQQVDRRGQTFTNYCMEKFILKEIGKV